MRIVNKAMIIKAARMKEDGHTLEQIGQRLEISASRVSHILAALKGDVEWASRVSMPLPKRITDRTLIRDLGLSVRLTNGLLSLCGDATVGDVRRLSDAKLRSIPNVGKVSLDEWRKVSLSLPAAPKS